MSDDLERLSRLLDDLAAERDPRDRADLTADEARLAETASLLKGANGERVLPDDAFVEQLGARLAASRADEPGQPGQTHETDVPSHGLSRRGLLGRLAAGAAGLVAGAGAGASVGGSVAAATAYDKGRRDGYRHAETGPYQAPLVPDDRGAWLDTGQRAQDIAPGHAVHFQVGAHVGYIVNPGGGRPLYALSAACTHMGCLVSWLKDAESFLCPCHGAQYRADGTTLSGVARHPLPRMRLRRDADGRLYVWGVTPHPAITTLAPYRAP